MNSQTGNAPNMGHGAGAEQTAMNQCKCGNEFAADARFCPFCGEQAQSTAADDQSQGTNQGFTPVPNPSATSAPVNNPNPAFNYGNSNQAPEKKGLGTGAIVAIVIGIVVALMVCGALAFFALSAVISDDFQRSVAVESENRSEGRNQDDDWDLDDLDLDDLDWDDEWFEPVVLPSNLRVVSVFTERGDRLLYEDVESANAFEYAINANGTFILYLDLSNRDDNFIEGRATTFRVRSSDMWSSTTNSMPGFDMWPDNQVFYSVMFDGNTATFLGNTTVSDWILFGYMAKRDDGKWILYDTDENLAYVLEEVDSSEADDEVH